MKRQGKVDKNLPCLCVGLEKTKVKYAQLAYANECTWQASLMVKRTTYNRVIKVQFLCLPDFIKKEQEK